MAASLCARFTSRAQYLNLCFRHFRSFHHASCLQNDSSSNNDSAGIKEIDFVKAEDTIESEKKLTGFARAFERHANVGDPGPSAGQQLSDPLDDSSVPFSEVFRKSSHVHLGAAHNQLVLGKIFHVVEDDLYIDFGGKFHCVCKRPSENKEKYHHGAKVRLRLKDIELTDHFVGASRDLTLLEADAELLGLVKQK